MDLNSPPHLGMQNNPLLERVKISSQSPYADYDREIRAIVRTILRETPDLRVITDFLKFNHVEIIDSRKHPDRVGMKGIVTSCGTQEEQLYVGVKFDPLDMKKSTPSLSQIFFLTEVRFLR